MLENSSTSGPQSSRFCGIDLFETDMLTRLLQSIILLLRAFFLNMLQKHSVFLNGLYLMTKKHVLSFRILGFVYIYLFILIRAILYNKISIWNVAV